MRISATLALVGLLAALGAPVRAQSLAEVARQEADRRKAVPTSGKVYTNKDLKGVPPAPPSDASATASPDAAVAPSPSADGTNPAVASIDSANPASSADAAPADLTSADDQAGIDKQAADGEARDEAYWSGRMRMLAEERDRDEVLAEALQSRVNALTADFAGRDDPAQRAKIGKDREKALAELDRLEKVVAANLRSIAMFEEEARRAGVPPGWLR